MDFRRGKRKKRVEPKREIAQEQPAFVPFATHTRKDQKPPDENAAGAGVSILLDICIQIFCATKH